MLRRINWEALFGFVVLGGFSVFFFILLFSGRITLYIHPRMTPYVWAGAAALLLLAWVTGREILTPRRKPRMARYAMFLVVLAAAFVIPPAAVESSSLTFTAQTGKPGTKTTAAASTVPSSDSSPATDLPPEQNGSVDIPTPALVNGTVDITEDNFSLWMAVIFNDLQKYDGMPVRIHSQVYRDDTFASDMFAATRLMMTCCVADVSPVGFYCRYDKTFTLQKNAWVEITGTIHVEPVENVDTAVIHVDTVTSAQPGKQEYLYPYGF